MENLKSKLKEKRLKIILFSVSIFTVSVLLLAALLNGSFEEKSYVKIWDQSYVDGLESQQHQIIAGALKAGSSHNMQPWLVEEVSETSIKLYADMTKDLKVVDPTHVQMLMSQGTFIEAYVTTAAAYGYDTLVTYGPMDLNESLPLIATLTRYPLGDDTEVDAISSSSFMQSQGSMSHDQLMDTLNDINENFPRIKLTLMNEDRELDDIKPYLREANFIESHNKAATDELLDVFRWTERDKNQFRYGLTATGMTSFARLFTQPLMKYMPSNYDMFASTSIDMFEERLLEEDAYILFNIKEPTSIDYLEAGRVYQELMATTSALAIRPSIQVLESYEAMLALGEKFHQAYDNEGLVVQILGVKSTENARQNKTPRHLVEDILLVSN